MARAIPAPICTGTIFFDRHRAAHLAFRPFEGWIHPGDLQVLGNDKGAACVGKEEQFAEIHAIRIGNLEFQGGRCEIPGLFPGLDPGSVLVGPHVDV